MTSFQKTLLALVVIVCVVLIGLGLYLRQYTFVILGGLFLALIILWGGAVLLKKVLDRLIEANPRALIGSAVVAYLILVTLIFIQPAVPFFAGLLMAVGPALIFLVEIRGHSENIGPGCRTIIVPVLAGALLMVLVLLIKPGEFSQFLSGVWQP